MKRVLVFLCLCLCLPTLVYAETDDRYPATEDRYPNNGLTPEEEALRQDSVSSDGNENVPQSDLYTHCPIFVDESDGQPTELYNMLQDLFNLIKIASPALVIVLSTIDYLGAIAKSNDDAVKKANSMTVKRIIIGLAIFFLPFLLDIVFEIFGLVDVSRCGIGT